MSKLSIYIPRVQAYVDENTIKNIFYNELVGIVSRVDFTPINKKPGFNESEIVEFKSAFVHFEEFTSTYLVQLLESGMSYNYYYNTVLWKLLKNKNPIVKTQMNTHQIVANCRYLEEHLELQGVKLEEQERLILLQGERISVLEKQIFEATIKWISSNKLEIDTESISTHSSMPSLEYEDDMSLDTTPDEIAGEAYCVNEVSEDIGTNYQNQAIKLV
jgi:hypothetical protein